MAKIICSHISDQVMREITILISPIHRVCIRIRCKILSHQRSLCIRNL